MEGAFASDLTAKSEERKSKVCFADELFFLFFFFFFSTPTSLSRFTLFRSLAFCSHDLSASRSSSKLQEHPIKAFLILTRRKMILISSIFTKRASSLSFSLSLSYAPPPPPSDAGV